MGAYDRRNFSVEEETHRDFFAGGFAVDIHENDGSFLAEEGDFFFDGEEGVFQRRVHESAGLHIDDPDFSFGGF